jgi:hypothetical protein
MPLFKKKLTPEELKMKLAMAEKKLAKREAMLKSKREKSRMEARECLKNGDERGFRLASKRFAMMSGQINAIGGMVEMSALMLDVVEMQTGLKEIVDIGAMLKDYQKDLGINTKDMEKTISSLKTSMDTVDAAAEMINTTMEVATAGDVSTSEAQESLKAELMAELETDTADGGIEAKIKAERDKL